MSSTTQTKLKTFRTYQKGLEGHLAVQSVFNECPWNPTNRNTGIIR